MQNDSVVNLELKKIGSAGLLAQTQLADLKVVVGLGNPGSKFVGTRHNIGFDFVDQLAERAGVDFRPWHGHLAAACDFLLADGQLSQILLLKPQTFMNNSGEVWPLLKKKGWRVDQILVIHDELEKAVGDLTIRRGGSARGHNGLRSLIAHAGEGFWRLRVGIGRPAVKEEVSHYVIHSFTPSEQALIQISVQQFLQLWKI